MSCWLACGQFAVVAGDASGRAHVGVIKCRHPSCERCVAIGAIRRGWNVRRGLGHELARADGLRAVVAGEARVGDKRMFRRTERCGREGRKILVAIAAGVG